MKVRVGFVSNSSSSSFIIIGRDIDISKCTSKMIKEKTIMVLGDYIYEGRDVFQIESIEELAFLKALNKLDVNSLTYIDSCVYQNDDKDEGEIDIKKIPRSGKIKYYTGLRDESSSYNLDILKERYDEFDKTKNIIYRYLRSTKLEKLKNK